MDIKGPISLAGEEMNKNPPKPEKSPPREFNFRALDTQVGGNHYKNMVIQPIEFITKNNLPFIIGNVIKYACRARSKNGIEDLRKAKHYLELEAELVYGEKL